jgi:hypothetical protein
LTENQPPRDGKKLDAMLKELVAIKKLLILVASKLEATSEDIGKVLDVDGSSIRHVLAEKKKKKGSKVQQNENVEA